MMIANIVKNVIRSQIWVLLPMKCAPSSHQSATLSGGSTTIEEVSMKKNYCDSDGMCISDIDIKCKYYVKCDCDSRCGICEDHISNFCTNEEARKEAGAK